MFVLSLIGLIAAGIALYEFIKWFNRYTQAKVKYEFFTKDHTTAMVLSYGMLFFGHQWYETATAANGDALNGTVVMIVGGIILFGVILNNFNKSPRKMAYLGTIMQLILYIPITIAAVFVVLGILAVVSQTKPTYNLNSRD
ncbi:MAG: hypothetical protein Q8M39_03150 [Sulfuricurvum sp.]|nr:hypothetical protein [Sulfuricurvum sp.]